MDFSTLGLPICGTEAPTFLGLFDFSTAPHLLFYAYVPIVIASLMFGAYLVSTKNKSLRTKLLIAVLSFFVLWVLNVLVQWVASYHSVLMFAWQMTAVLEVGMYVTAAYFAYVFIFKKDVPFWSKAALSVVVLAVLAVVPTPLNISAYDMTNCEGIVGPLWDVIYWLLEPAAILALIVMGVKSLHSEKDPIHRREVKLFTASFAFFMTAFLLSNLFGEVTGVYEFNLWGPLGMVVFFVILGYMMVRLHTFHAKLIAAELLVWSLVILIGSQFFFIISPVNYFLNAITFFASIVFGILLIRSVRLEIRQKEELGVLLKQRESLEHLVTHKVKGAFTRTKFIFAEVIGGTYGPITGKLRDISQQGLEFSDDGIFSVDQVLNAANLKKGKIEYERKPVDFKGVVQIALSQKKGPAERKGLVLESDIKEGKYTVTGDVFWLKEVAYNLVDNAVKYTPEGKITVSLNAIGGKLVFSVRDTGGGITEEDKKVLFTEGGRGKESVKVNADSTGYGLFTIKLVVEAHHGRVWVESTHGHGSTFFVELPLSHQIANIPSAKPN